MEAIVYKVTQYYKFVPVPDPTALCAAQTALCEELGLLGRIYVAEEGINGTVGGPPAAVAAYMHAMHADPRFEGTLFKSHDTAWVPFRKLSVRLKPELVALKSPIPTDPNHTETGDYVSPEEMRDLLANPNPEIVLLDARSRYEHELGRFRGAITLPIENFRDLPTQMDKIAHLRDKSIVTYCTGGIKCEKLTALLKAEGFADVRQLYGGILHYAELTGGAYFDGRCYVFDDRVAVAVNHVNPTVAAACSACAQPADLPVNCANIECHKRVNLCQACAEALQGCCSEACFRAPRRRPWNGTGRFVRGQVGAKA